MVILFNMINKPKLYIQDIHIFIIIHSYRIPLILFITFLFSQNSTAFCDWLTDFRSYFFSSTEINQEKSDKDATDFINNPARKEKVQDV